MTDNAYVATFSGNDAGEKQWPAVNSAYDFVIPSYQLLTSRFESADTRLTALLTLASTLTIAVPIFAKTVRPGVSFTSFSFGCGVLAFILGACIGIYGRVTGSIVLPDPMVIYKKNLHKSEWEFRKDQIYFAGKNFDANAQAVRRKGNVSIFVTITLLAEVLAFGAWIIR